MSQSKGRTIEERALEMTREVADGGQLMESGWAAFRYIAIPARASQAQLVDMRLAFLGGAEHAWSSLFSMLSSGNEPTEADMRRLELVEAEIKSIRSELRLTFNGTQGSA